MQGAEDNQSLQQSVTQHIQLHETSTLNQSTTVFRQFRYRCLNSKSSFRTNIKTKCYDSQVNDPRSLWLYLLAYLYTLAVAREA